MKRTSPSPKEARDLEATMEVSAVGSQVPFYEQVYASLKKEMEVISQFLEVSKEEGTAIHDAATLKIVRDTMEKDVKEVSETAQSIIEKLEQLDTVHASNKGYKEDSPTDQCFRNMRNSYITQVEEVLNVVTSLARVEMQRTDGEDHFTYSWSDTDSMISARKRLERLRMVDSSAGVEIQRIESAVIQLQGVAKRFNYDELQTATEGFSEKLGNGGFGSVYLGVLPSGIHVAVKRMNPHSTHGQGMKEFKGEVSIITQLRHRNLIELQGWCEDQARKEYMLVYELMPNGSLDNLLFKHSVTQGGAAGEEGTEPRGGKSGVVKGTFCLSWPQRFNILTGIADALDYLHQGWKHQVIHGDIKCANILLDKEWHAKLTDFGLSRLVDHEGEAYTIHFAGTKGYAAPELFTEGRFTDKSDVFAFGAVVLEVVCGRRNWPGDAHEMSLVEWVRERLSKGDLISVVDEELRGFDRHQMERHQMETVLMIGLACCEFHHWKRPSMRLVVKMLAGERHDELMEMMVVKQKAEDVPGPSKEAPDGEDFSTNHALNVDFEAKDQESENIAYVLPPPPPPLFPPLPPKWKEAIDIETGHRYYYSPETNESSWERPKAGIVIADQNKMPGNSSTGPREPPPNTTVSEFQKPARYESIEKGKNIVEHEETLNSERGYSSASDHEIQLENDNRSEWWEPIGAAVSNSEVKKIVQIASCSATNSIPHLKKISDFIYILHETPNPKVEVFFIHDLNWRQYEQPHIQSWMSSGMPSVCWPVNWLSAKYPEAQILLANYDAGPWNTNTDGLMRVQLIAENIGDDILSIHTKDCPLVLVGHGLGGVVIKELVRSLQRRQDAVGRHLHAHQHSADNKNFLKLDSLLRNVRGVLFFTPPFLGSGLIDYKKIKLMGSLLKDMEVMNTYILRLNEWFQQWRKYRRCKVTTILAALPFKGDLPIQVAPWYRHLTTYIVEEGAARFDTDIFYTSRANHFSVCKLHDETDSSFSRLTELIGTII